MPLNADNFVLADYLNRIGFQGEARADIATLTALMEKQLMSLAFENLDVQVGKVVSLKPEDIVSKIVYGQRGGYCYELNGLFAMVLTALNIPYQLVGCRPMFYAERRPKTHMAIVAMLDQQSWLCDLGFGSYGMRQPLALAQAGQVIRQGYDDYRLMLLDAEYVFEARVDGRWQSQYRFDLYPQEWIDFFPANWLNSTYPESLFVKKLLVLRFHPQGRDILLDDQWRSFREGQVTTTVLEPDERLKLLREQFDLNPPEGFA